MSLDAAGVLRVLERLAADNEQQTENEPDHTWARGFFTGQAQAYASAAKLVRSELVAALVAVPITPDAIDDPGN